MKLGTNKQRKENGRRWLLNHANGVKRRLAFGKQVAKNDAGVIGRLLPPLSQKSYELFFGTHIKKRGIFISMGERAYTKRAAK